ncbi:MAG: hypothetical protein ACO3UU_06300 [Minisyncoccia bacterium]
MKNFYYPFNFYNRDYFYEPYRYYPSYYPIPFNNYVRSNIATTQQSIYNTGYMTDVFQQSNIMQSAAGICTEPMPGEPPVPPEEPPVPPVI